MPMTIIVVLFVGESPLMQIGVPVAQLFSRMDRVPVVGALMGIRRIVQTIDR